MNPRTTLVLLVLALALGAFILLVERRQTEAYAREIQARKALRVDPARVTRLALQRQEMQVTLEKNGYRWRLAAPLTARADAGQVERILHQLEELPRQAVISEMDLRQRSMTLADLGLETPRARLAIVENQVEREILIGRDTPMGNGLYLRIAGHPEILCTPTNILQVIPTQALALRDRQLLHGDPSTVTRFDLRGDSGFIQLIRDEAGQWRMLQPYGARADRQLISGMLGLLINGRIEQFVQDNVTDYTPFGLDSHALTVVLGSDLKEGAQMVSFGAPVPAASDLVYARVQAENSVYAVSRDIESLMQVRPMDLCDRHLLPLPGNAIQRLRIEEGEQFLEMARNATGWEITVPKTWPGEAAAIEALLKTWDALRAADFEAGLTPVPGFAPPARRILLSTKALEAAPGAGATGDWAEVVFNVGAQPASNGLTRVQLQGESLYYLVPGDALTGFALSPLAYRSRQILHLKPADISQLAWAQGATNIILQRGSQGGFTPQPPATGTVNSELAAQLLAEVCALTAARLVECDPKHPEVYGLHTPVMTLTLALDAGQGIGKSILIGQPAPEGGRYAMIRGHELVFTLPPPTLRLLMEPPCLATNALTEGNGHGRKP